MSKTACPPGWHLPDEADMTQAWNKITNNAPMSSDSWEKDKVLRLMEFLYGHYRTVYQGWYDGTWGEEFWWTSTMASSPAGSAKTLLAEDNPSYISLVWTTKPASEKAYVRCVQD